MFFLLLKTNHGIVNINHRFMETSVKNTHQKKRIHNLSVLTLVLLVASFLWLIYNVYAFNQIRQKATNIDAITIGLAFGYLVKGCLYLSLVILFIKTFKYFVHLKFLGILTIITGIVSAISVVFDFAALSDIGHEYLEQGLECFWEWTWLYIGLLIHVVFYVVGFLFVVKLESRINRFNGSKVSQIKEIYFEVVQYVGIVCGLVGTVFSVFISFYIGNTKTFSGDWIIWLILAYSAIIIVPYVMFVFYWLLKLTRSKELAFYDEKQKNDLVLSGITTLLVSIPLLTLFFIFNFGKTGFAASTMWFPFYLFLIVLVFSVSALYRYKKR